MPQEFSKFSKSDYARYPFLKAASKYVRDSDLGIEELTNPQYGQILRRAEERLDDAVLYAQVSYDTQTDDTIEIMSFAASMILSLATKDPFIQKRYALAEANQAYESLKEEPKEKLLEFAHNFGWKLAPIKATQAIPYELSIHFADYLRNTRHLREGRWKLLNRFFSEGIVYLGRDETARLLKEEVQRYINDRLETMNLPTFPKEIADVAERIRTLARERIGQTEMEGFPKAVVQTAFPPCIDALYQAFTSGRHLSHVGRFTLTSFLVNIGMAPEKVIELFRSVSDFNERMTRYQVEHIAGEKGSRTKYIPPLCDTLRTHGVCMNPDDLCRKVRHPLVYYKRKLRTPR